MSFWEKYAPISYSGLIYVIAAVSDWLSSSLCNYIPYLVEENPLTRDNLYHFSLWRGVLLDLFFAIIVAMISSVAYFAFSRISKSLGKFAACALPLYLGLYRILTAVIPNFILFFEGLHRMS